MNRACNTKKIGLAPWAKVKVIKFQLQRQCQSFLYQTLCAFFQVKYIKHIKWDVCSDAWVMPQGWDLSAQGLFF